MRRVIEVNAMGCGKSTRLKLYKRIIENCKKEGDCWIWQGATSGTKESTRGHGYGRISVYGQTSAVHRVMWSCVYGYLPSAKQVDHKCNNRLCCNPEHLELVTHKENQKRKSNRQKSNGTGKQK